MTQDISNMAEEKLLPCPFCGGTKTKEQRTGVDDECVFIQCVSCEAGGPTSFPRQDNDVPTWNTRASGYTEGLKAVGKAVNPNDIMKYFDEKNKRIIDEFGWTGQYNVNAKDILDFLIDVVQ